MIMTGNISTGTQIHTPVIFLNKKNLLTQPGLEPGAPASSTSALPTELQRCFLNK